MPIFIKDYTWTQSSTALNIQIALKPVNRDKIDVFTTDSYIKIHFSPFFFEVFLLHDVDNNVSKCIVKEDLIVLDLVKKQELNWECLEKNLTKENKKKIRQDILEKCQEEAKTRSEEKAIKKSQLDRFTVQKAMDIDSKKHELMDLRRDAERNKAMNELEQWRVTNTPIASTQKIEKNVSKFELNNIKISTENKQDGVIITELTTSDEEDGKIDKKIDLKKKELPLKKPTSGRIERKLIKSEYIERKKSEIATRVLPKLRETAELEIKHTPRSFPTPMRESAQAEEEAWLKNISQARRATGFVSEDLRPEEQDPQWCKEKGDEFFRSGNFLGAISAYTHGITLSDKLPSLYSNRAATHFALGNFNKCINDCSTALELMKPPCEGNRHSRAKCIARRAAALARVGYLSKAIDEMKAASKLLPDDEKIKKDIFNMERAWEQNPDSD